MIVDRPYANDKAQSDFRRTLLGEPHMVALADYVAKLRAKYPDDVVPDFDPAGGGANAKVLILLEKPGFAAGEGSGLISPHNRDPSAKHLWDHMEAEGLARSLFVHWNVVPSWNGTRKITADEERRGASHLDELLALQPNVGAAVLCGKKAQRAGRQWSAKGIRIFSTAHPSMLSRNGPYSREDWKKIGRILRDAARSISDESPTE